MEVCKKHATNTEDTATSQDLWIQALTYFRDLPEPENEKRLEEALEIIGSCEKTGEKKEENKEELISPL